MSLALLCTVLATGGNETTSATIATSVFALLEHPEQAAMLRADPTLTAAAVEELNRLISAGDAPDQVRSTTATTQEGVAELPVTW